MNIQQFTPSVGHIKPKPQRLSWTLHYIVLNDTKERLIGFCNISSEMKLVGFRETFHHPFVCLSHCPPYQNDLAKNQSDLLFVRCSLYFIWLLNTCTPFSGVIILHVPFLRYKCKYQNSMLIMKLNHNSSLWCFFYLLSKKRIFTRGLIVDS